MECLLGFPALAMLETTCDHTACDSVLPHLWNTVLPTVAMPKLALLEEQVQWNNCYYFILTDKIHTAAFWYIATFRLTLDYALEPFVIWGLLLACR